MGLFKRFPEETKDYAYFAFRLIFGILFALHGMQKIGWLTGKGMDGFMLFIGWSELLIGLGILLGLLVRLAAIGGIVIMVGALVTAHMPKGFLPLGNGESAWLYLIAFVMIFAFGAAKWSLDKALFKKEIF